MSLSSIGTKLQKIVWTKRAQSWEDTPNPGLDEVVSRIIELSRNRGSLAAIDLGCGSGQLAIPLAREGHQVLAVDIAPTMLKILEKKAANSDISSITTKCVSLEDLDLPSGSYDLVVSNYVLHHLSDLQKQKVVEKSYAWLKPGGKIIIGDMMFGRGGTAEDRKIIASKMMKLAKLGPGGWWRITKNIFRFTFRIQEKPVSADTWKRYFLKAGFSDIKVIPVIGEASIAIAVKGDI